MIRKLRITVPDFVRNEIPAHLRDQPNLLALFQGLSAPLAAQATGWVTFRDAAITRARVSNQSISLEWYLNERFDSSARRIYIETAGISGRVAGIRTTEPTKCFVAGKSATEPAKCTMIGLKGEDTGFGSNSFLVFVPAALSAYQDAIAGIVRQYKLAGKKFSIKLF